MGPSGRPNTCDPHSWLSNGLPGASAWHQRREWRQQAAAPGVGVSAHGQACSLEWGAQWESNLSLSPEQDPTLVPIMSQWFQTDLGLPPHRVLP